MEEIKLVSSNWDTELAGMTYEELKSVCLFACIWSERKEGGYNNYDFYPFIAIKKVNNQGIEAYEGITIREAWEGDFENKKRVVQVEGKCYMALSFFGNDETRLTIVSNPDEIIPIFLSRWK